MNSAVFSGAAEGLLDGVVLRRLITHLGHEVGPVYGERGVADLIAHSRGYNAAAEHSPWLILFDLDQAACAPVHLATILPARAKFMCCRIAVREVESWLLADPERLAAFLRVGRGRVPADPDDLADAKGAMVTIANRSRNRSIRHQMVSHRRDGTTGPAYTATLIEFVTAADGWRPEVARVNSDSLQRALTCIDACAKLWLNRVGS